MNTESDPRGGRKNIALVYPYLMHYRQPVARALMGQSGSDAVYTFISGKTVDGLAKNLKLIEPALADKPLEEGGLRWRFVHNIWLGGITLWQRGLLSMTFGKSYDAIIYHGAMYYLTTWFSAVAARLQGKRVLMWSHGFYGTETGMKSVIRKAFFRLAHGMLLYGHHSRKIMIERGFDPDSLYVIYNSLDYDEQKQVRNVVTRDEVAEQRSALFSQQDWPIVFFSGRLVAGKRLDMIFDAAAKLAQRDVRLNILIVGDGPERAALEQCAEAQGLSECTCFYGACYDERTLGRLIMASSLCVSPEGVGLTAIHSLAYGVPVVTHDDVFAQKPEYEAIVPGVSGDFFRRGDIDDLAAVTERMLVRVGDGGVSSTQCIDIVDRLYNPDTQLKILNAAIDGVPASRVLSELGDDTHQRAL